MTPERKAELFKAIREIKTKGLTQAEVDLVNAILDRPEGQAPAPAPAPAPSGGRKTSDKGIALMHEFEGYRETTYADPGPTGLPVTGGWGTTRDENGQPFKLGVTYPREYWVKLYRRDMGRFEKAVEKLVGSAPTTQGQFDALVSFAYNVGEGGLKTSTLLRMHKAGDYAGAAGQFGRWNKAGKKVLPGLTRRRAAEAALYAS